MRKQNMPKKIYKEKGDLSGSEFAEEVFLHKKINQNAYKKWTMQENARYALFLAQNESEFASEWLRRSRRVYSRMSQIIPSKSANQCKSHHYKMIKHNGNFKKIIKKCLVKKWSELKDSGFIEAYLNDIDGRKQCVKVEPDEMNIKFLDIKLESQPDELNYKFLQNVESPQIKSQNLNDLDVFS